MTNIGKISTTNYPTQTINLKQCKVIVGQADNDRVVITISKKDDNAIKVVLSESHTADLQVLTL